MVLLRSLPVINFADETVYGLTVSATSYFSITGTGNTPYEAGYFTPTLIYNLSAYGLGTVTDVGPTYGLECFSTPCSPINFTQYYGQPFQQGYVASRYNPNGIKISGGAASVTFEGTETGGATFSGSGKVDVSVTATVGSSLLTPEQKAIFGNISAISSADGNALSAAGFMQSASVGVFDTLSLLGLVASAPSTSELLSQQVINTGSVELDAIDVAKSCAALGPACTLALIGIAFDVTGILAKDIQADPSDPNYKNVFVPSIGKSVPLIGSSSSLAAAATATLNALDRTNEFLDALVITYNRYVTALGANDLASANLQAKAFANYLTSYERAVPTARTDLSAFANDLSAAGLGSQLFTAVDETDALNFLRTQDPSSLDSLLTPLGFTDAEIATLVLDAENAPPPLPTETIVGALNSEAQGLTGLAAVPEPSSWAMILVGFAGLGFASYRTSRKASAARGDA